MDFTTQKGVEPNYYSNKRVRIHRPTGAPADEWYPQREALLYRDRKFLSSLRNKLSGKWEGYCLQDSGKRVEFTFHLHFEDSNIKGEGQDLSGNFILEGTYCDTELSISLIKKYASSSIEYKGYYKGDRAFSGEWSLSGVKGYFELYKGLEHGQGLLPSPPELSHHDHTFLRTLSMENLTGDWVGHCTQGNDIYDLNLALIFNKGFVSGGGSDGAGKFTWTGMYDPREMHLSLIKNYPTHRVYFNGFFKKNKTFEGDWVLDDDACGFFRVTKQA